MISQNVWSPFRQNFGHQFATILVTTSISKRFRDKAQPAEVMNECYVWLGGSFTLRTVRIGATFGQGEKFYSALEAVGGLGTARRLLEAVWKLLVASLEAARGMSGGCLEVAGGFPELSGGRRGRSGSRRSHIVAKPSSLVIWSEVGDGLRRRPARMWQRRWNIIVVRWRRIQRHGGYHICRAICAYQATA